MGVKLDDLTVLRVDYIWLSAEIYAEKLFSSVLANNYVQGEPFDNVIEALRLEGYDEPPDSAHPPGATDEDRIIFNERFAEYWNDQERFAEELREQFEESKSTTEPDIVREEIIAEMMAARKNNRRMGFTNL